MKKVIRDNRIILCFFIAAFCIVAIRDLDASPQLKKKSKSEVKETQSAEEEIAKLDERVNSTAKVVNNLSKKITKIDSVQTASREDIQMLKQSVSQLQEIVKSFNASLENIRRINGVLEDRAVYADSVNAQLLDQLISLENRIVSLSASVGEFRTVSDFGGDEAASLAAGDSYKERYLKALTLHQKSQHLEAIDIFRQLVNEDKTNELADNAQYWIGECYYSLKQSQRAIVEFEKVLSFSNSNKDDDAQFKMGLCYMALGNPAKANEQFKLLIERFPQSEFVPSAKQYIK
ncbi:MAG: tetratricopeptide repeat protein [Candidatus Marinimicrobia bacterium]|nr:tetratricopeptide repeat protein [Candidatus Neomarinimicrobiota bacterium]